MEVQHQKKKSSHSFLSHPTNMLDLYLCLVIMRITTEVWCHIWIVLERFFKNKFAAQHQKLQKSPAKPSHQQPQQVVKPVQVSFFTTASEFDDKVDCVAPAPLTEESTQQFDKINEIVKPSLEIILVLMPKNIAISFLKHWVTFSELCMVDTAFCSLSTRDGWLNTISSFEGGVNIVDSCVEEKDGKTSHLTKLEWLRLKNMSVNELVIQSDLADFNKLYKTDLLKGMKCLKKMTFTRETDMLNSEWIIRSNFPCETLESLSLNSNYHKTYTEKIIRTFPNLKELVFSAGPSLTVNDEYLQLVLTRFTKQTELQMQNGEVSDKMLMKVVDKHRQQLRIVNVNNTTTYMESEGVVSGVSIVRLIEKCLELRELRMAHRHNVNDLIAQKIAKHCSLLEVLDISKTDISSSGIALILNSCQKLTTLVVCSMDIGVTAPLAESTHNLTWLNASASNIRA